MDKKKNNTFKTILVIIAIVAAVAAAIALIITYKDEITACIEKIKEKLNSRKTAFTKEECEDFADI